MNYTNSEMCDMHFVYGRANGNSLAAMRLYEEMNPNRVIPHHTMFARLRQRLGETGSFKKLTNGNGRPRTVSTPDVEEQVLQELEDSPTTSTRKIAATLHISHSTVFRVLKNQLLYPYHFQRVQALLPTDFPARVALCRWMQQKIAHNPHHLAEVFFIDEANFSRDAISNFHNNHIWAGENPHAIVESRHQHQFSLNVWVGIVGDHLIGPFFLPARLTGDVYRHDLPTLLEDIPLQLRSKMYFMHDGAPAHFCSVARNYLNTVYPRRWISRGGTKPWPPRSPDLNALDFFLWGHLKHLVYGTTFESSEELRARIIECCDTIQHTHGIFERVRQSMRRRIEACIAAEGAHFQHLL
ncbi:UNVERIFIED_CONTAM: hypothetical protein RMT77_008772 [Armadillidium vulgare]